MSKQALTIGELFSQTWTEYKRRALPILAVILISYVIVGGLIMVMVLTGMFGGVILTHFIDNRTAIYITVALISILLLIITVLIIWCQGAMLAIVVDEDMSIVDAFQKGWEYLWPLAWVITILSGILITGFSFGVLPGFLFLVWFSFCAFIMIEENRRGMETLLVSKEYVRGHGWNTCGKMIILWFITAIAGLIPFLGQILTILLTPFMMLYLLIMYRDLKSIKEPIELEDGSGPTIFWWIITIIGLVIPIAVLIVLLYMLLTGDQNWMTPAWESMHGTSL